MLAGVHDQISSGLLALAGGWPAVIGLASVMTTTSLRPSGALELPQQLYEYFAAEVYRALEPESRIGLGLLATAPSLDRDLAADLLGRDRAERVCAEALTLGVIEERDGRLDLHPLAAAFSRSARSERRRPNLPTRLEPRSVSTVRGANGTRRSNYWIASALRVSNHLSARRLMIS